MSERYRGTRVIVQRKICMVFRLIGSWIGRQELRLGIRTGRLRQPCYTPKTG